MRNAILILSIIGLFLSSACGGLTRRSEAVPSRDLEILDTVVEEKRTLSRPAVVAVSTPAEEVEFIEREEEPEVVVAAIPEDRTPVDEPAESERVAPTVDTETMDTAIPLPEIAREVKPEPAIETTAEMTVPDLPAESVEETRTPDPPVKTVAGAEPDSVPMEEPPVESAPEPKAAASYRNVYLSGYRVQLMATTEPDLARGFAETVRPLFDAKVYVEYLEPFYKVRIGDCEMRSEAVLLLNKARTLGFGESWITATQIIDWSEGPR